MSPWARSRRSCRVTFAVSRWASSGDAVGRGEYRRRRRSRLRKPAVAHSPRATARRGARSAGAPRRRAGAGRARVGGGGAKWGEEGREGGAVVNGGEVVQVVFVGALGNLGAPVEIGDALAEGAPGAAPAGLVVEGAEDLEVGGLADGGLDAQDAPGLVVHRDRVAVDPVLDADAFGAGRAAADEFAGEVAMDLASQEAHDVGALEVQGGVTDERRVDPGERPGGREEQVGGPLALVGRPVVALGPGPEDLGVEGVERSGEGIEGARPGDGELVIHQPLGAGGVPQPREGVIVAAELDPLALEVRGEPLPAVEADLDGEGEPGLQAGAEEAEDPVPVVLVDVETLPGPKAEAALVGIRRAVILEAHAGFDRLEGADQALVHGVFGEQAAGEGLLVYRAGLQVADGAVVLERLAQRRCLDAFAGRQDIRLEVEEGDLGPRQDGVHPPRPHQGNEGAPKHEAVEAGEHGRDERAVAGKESLHGVVLEVGGWVAATYVPEKRRHFQRWVAGASPR